MGIEWVLSGRIAIVEENGLVEYNFACGDFKYQKKWGNLTNYLPLSFPVKMINR
jgi:hypothetical protein